MYILHAAKLEALQLASNKSEELHDDVKDTSFTYLDMLSRLSRCETIDETSQSFNYIYEAHIDSV